MPGALGNPHDLFGEALTAYAAGDRSPFTLADETGRESIYSLAGRFRPPSRLNATERKLMTQARDAGFSPEILSQSWKYCLMCLRPSR